MPKRKKSDSKSKSASHSRSRSSHDNESDPNVEETDIFKEIGQDLEDTDVGGNNMNNIDGDENENFGLINDDDRETGSDEEKEEDNSDIQPLDPDLIPIMKKLSEINVDQLEGDESNKLNLNRVYIDVQLLRRITPSLQQKAMTYGVRRRNNNNQDVIFSRLMLCRVYSKKKVY